MSRECVTQLCSETTMPVFASSAASAILRSPYSFIRPSLCHSHSKFTGCLTYKAKPFYVATRKALHETKKRRSSTQASVQRISGNVLPDEQKKTTTRSTPVPEKYLGCCMPNRENPLKIAVLISGGVDSSVALRLLCAAGHSCTAFYLKIWFQEDFQNFWSSCPWDEDLRYAESVCDQAGVSLQVLNLTDEYWKNVVSYIISEYKSGRTPNPDVLCNSRIKFGAFLDYIEEMDFDYVASGHYACVKHPGIGSNEKDSSMCLSKDNVKDQTYFLSHLSQEQLRRVIFPLGCMSKEEVRNLAAVMGLPNKDRKDSQGLCFLGKVKFSEFVERHIGEMEGLLIEAETGDFLGKHKGYWFYTIGQRQGLRLPGGPWYVVAKDVENNVVFVSRNYFSVDKKRCAFHVGSLRWISGHPPQDFDGVQCKVRHGPKLYDCHIGFARVEQPDEHCENYHSMNNLKQDIVAVRLEEDDQGLAAGQFAAFYRGDVCLGSGVIIDSLESAHFTLCHKAIELARMKDKSVLGEPVKIKVLSNGNSSMKLERQKKVQCQKPPSVEVLTVSPVRYFWLRLKNIYSSISSQLNNLKGNIK